MFTRTTPSWTSPPAFSSRCHRPAVQEDLHTVAGILPTGSEDDEDLVGGDLELQAIAGALGAGGLCIHAPAAGKGKLAGRQAGRQREILCRSRPHVLRRGEVADTIAAHVGLGCHEYAGVRSGTSPAATRSGWSRRPAAGG